MIMACYEAKVLYTPILRLNIANLLAKANRKRLPGNYSPEELLH